MKKDNSDISQKISNGIIARAGRIIDTANIFCMPGSVFGYNNKLLSRDIIRGYIK